MNRQLLIYRIIIDFIIFVFVLEGWWYAILPLGIVALWSFPFYIEFLLFGIIYDSLFGFTFAIGWFGYTGTIVTLLISISMSSLRGKLRLT